jgi:hypothetical protein
MLMTTIPLLSVHSSDWFPFCSSSTDIIGNDTFLLRDVSLNDTWAFLTNMKFFKQWILGGGESFGAENWLAKKPFNLKAQECFKLMKHSSIYGDMLILWEIVEEEKLKFVKSVCRIVTFCDGDDVDKQTVMEAPTIEYVNEFRIVNESIDGTIINRRSFSYKNHGAMPVFIEAWIEEENKIMIEYWVRRKSIPHLVQEPQTKNIPQKAKPKLESGLSISFSSLF